MPAAAPVIAAYVTTALAAGAATYQGIQSNQQAQHAKGAAQAQQTAFDSQIKTQQDADATQKKNAATQAGSTQTAAIAALKASMSATNTGGGTILTSGQGTGAAPVQGKTLLGA